MKKALEIIRKKKTMEETGAPYWLSRTSDKINQNPTFVVIENSYDRTFEKTSEPDSAHLFSGNSKLLKRNLKYIFLIL